MTVTLSIRSSLIRRIDCICETAEPPILIELTRLWSDLRHLDGADIYDIIQNPKVTILTESENVMTLLFDSESIFIAKIWLFCGTSSVTIVDYIFAFPDISTLEAG